MVKTMLVKDLRAIKNFSVVKCTLALARYRCLTP